MSEIFIDEFRTIFFINFSKAILDTFCSAFCFANNGIHVYFGGNLNEKLSDNQIKRTHSDGL